MDNLSLRFSDDLGLRPWFVRQRFADMRVSDQVLKSVVFLGVMEKDKFIPRAAGFLTTYQFMQHTFTTIVTAEHVVALCYQKGSTLHVRLQLDGGDTAVVEMPFDRWRFYPDESNRTDVAVFPIPNAVQDMETGKWTTLDAKTVPLNGDKVAVATADIISEHDIGVGEEVFIAGLFRSHYGKERNRPIVRIGHIAAMCEEPVKTSWAGYTEAYLIEAMSIGGLSGSPVFVNMAPVRTFKGTHPFTQGRQFYLLGLIQGHFDIANLNDDATTDDPRDSLGSINMGIGVVIPVEKIIATVEHPDLLESMKSEIMALRAREGSTSDLALDPEGEAPTGSHAVTPDNPTHLEDFTRLVGAAARSKSKAD